MKPRIYREMPSEEYHAAPGANFSRLKILRHETPADLKAYIDEPPPPSDPMNLGAAIHDMLLLPDKFASQWAISGQCEAFKADGERCENSGTKFIEGKWYCGVHSKGKSSEAVHILSSDDARVIRGLEESAKRHKYAARLFADDVETELSLFWNDPETGILCKARIDLYNRSRKSLVDLKTTSKGIDFKSFRRSCEDFGLWLQLAHYKAGAEILGLEVNFAAWLAIQTRRPYGIMTWQADEHDLALAEHERRVLLNLYAQCEKSGVWPGYEEKIGVMSMSPWETRDIEERVEQEVSGERDSDSQAGD